MKPLTVERSPQAQAGQAVYEAARAAGADESIAQFNRAVEAGSWEEWTETHHHRATLVDGGWSWEVEYLNGSRAAAYGIAPSLRAAILQARHASR